MSMSCASRTVDRINEGYDWGGVGLHNIFAGHAGYQVFQNRLLGPLIAVAIQKITGMNNADSCQTTVMLGIYLSGLIIFFGILRKTNHLIAIVSAISTMFFYIVLQTPNQGHLEDSLDLALLSAFLCLVYSNASWKFLIPVFILQIINKETGLAIAAWIMISSFNIYSRRVKVDFKKIIVGIAMFLIGVTYIHWCRTSLWRGPLTEPMCSHLVFFGQWWMFSFKMPNIPWMIANMPGPLLIFALLLSGPFIIKNQFKNQKWQLFALNLMILIPVILFGMIGEQRVWIETVPFVVISFAAGNLIRGNAKDS